LELLIHGASWRDAELALLVVGSWHDKLEKVNVDPPNLESGPTVAYACAACGAEKVQDSGFAHL